MRKGGELGSVDADDFRLGHVLAGKADTFSAHAAIFETTERHGVETVIGGVVDHQTPPKPISAI